MAVFKALQTSGNTNVRSPRDVALGIIEGIGKEPREILFKVRLLIMLNTKFSQREYTKLVAGSDCFARR
jgi:hypothetical protein